MAVEADEMLTKLAKSEKKTAGQIKLTSKYEKEKKKITQDHQKDELTEYVNHFSNLAILMDDAKPSEGPSVALGFTKGLKDKFMQKKVQLDLKNAIQKSVLKRKEAKGESPDKDSPNRMFKKTELERLNERQVVFNKVLVEESKQMDNIKDTILRQKEYQGKYKTLQKFVDKKEDPHIEFFKHCSVQQKDLALPIMDKIWKKTLCLQNYYISEGNIAGLVAACEVLDFRLVNRLLLDNCGVTGDRFAEIL